MISNFGNDELVNHLVSKAPSSVDGTDSPSALDVDDELQIDWCLYWKISRLRPSKDAVCILRGMAGFRNCRRRCTRKRRQKPVFDIHAVGNETAARHKEFQRISRRAYAGLNATDAAPVE